MADTVRTLAAIQALLADNTSGSISPQDLRGAIIAAWRHMVADALTLTEPDELILVTLRRVTNGAADNTDNVFGLCVDFHYESDRHATLNKSPSFFA